MKIKDIVYGEITIEEPVLIELIKSKPFQRLKKISQYGIPHKYYHLQGFNRFEHSLGVMLLLKKLGATLEEQVAGLLHDVSILAFSHVADWVFGEGKKGVEGFHDSIHAKFISKTEIPEILRGFGFSAERVANTDNFSLLENNIPDLCADRVDYAFREFAHWLNPKVVKISNERICNLNGEIVFDEERSAFIFASHFLKLQTLHWGSLEVVRRYSLFSNALKMALLKKIIQKDDFYKDEEVILKKLEKIKDKEILNNLKILETRTLKNYKGKEWVTKKFRYVDPKIIVKTKLVRLSKLNPKFRRLLDRHKKINEKGVLA